MDDDILSLSRQALGGEFARRAGEFFGESESGLQAALDALLPAAVGVVAQRGATALGAGQLLTQMDNPVIDPGTLGRLPRLFTGGAAGASALMRAGTGLGASLFGDRAGALVQSVSAVGAVRRASASNLVALVLPLVLAVLKQQVVQRRLDAAALSALLLRQGPWLQSALDSRVTAALGHPNPGDFVRGLMPGKGRLGRAGAAAQAWPWVLLAIAVLGLLAWWTA